MPGALTFAELKSELAQKAKAERDEACACLSYDATVLQISQGRGLRDATPDCPVNRRGPELWAWLDDQEDYGPDGPALAVYLPGDEQWLVTAWVHF